MPMRLLPRLLMALQLVSEKKKAKHKDYKNSGVLAVTRLGRKCCAGRTDACSFVFVKQPSFVEWLRGGLQLHFAVAVDFTGSNGAGCAVHALMTAGRGAAPAQLAALHQPDAADTVLSGDCCCGRCDPGLLIVGLMAMERG